MNPDIIYYNCNLITQKLHPTDEDQICRYEENRPDPIVKNASDYQFSLIRASIDSSNIPCFIPKIVSGGNVNLTTYSISMSLNLNINGTITTTQILQPLLYVCRNKYVSQVPSVAGADSPYYYVFDLQHFVDMVNTTLKSLYSTLQIGAGVSFISQCPKMTLSGNTFNIYFDARGWGGADSTATGSQQEAFQLYFNDDLKNLLRNFNLTYAFDNSGMNWNLVVSNKLANNQTINGVLYYVESQSYSSLSTVFSPVSSIVFMSNMGILNEYIGQLQILNNNSITTNQSNNIENQIMDIALSVDNPMDYSSQIQYVASVFRFSEIIGKEIRSISISVYWKNKYNGINYPVLLSDGCGFNAKLMFQKKK